MRPEVVAVHIYMMGQFWQLPVTRAAPHVGGCTRERNAAVYKYIYGQAYDLTGPVRASQGSSTTVQGGATKTTVPLVMNRFWFILAVDVFFHLAVSPGGSTGAETVFFL